MRSIVIAVIALALVAPVPVYAQGIGSKSMWGDQKKPEKSEAERAKDRKEEEQREQAAKKALSGVPNREAKQDPWGNIR